jgi:hypothetical protein
LGRGGEEHRRDTIPRLERDVKHFERTLSFLFGIGFALLVSLFADYMGHVRIHEMWIILSNAAFLVALAEFVFLIIYYIINVSQQISGYRKDLDRYRP